MHAKSAVTTNMQLLCVSIEKHNQLSKTIETCCSLTIKAGVEAIERRERESESERERERDREREKEQLGVVVVVVVVTLVLLCVWVGELLIEWCDA